MKRYIKERLQRSGDCLLLDKEPYSGVMYELEENRSVGVFLVQQGEVTGSYINDAFPINEKLAGIDITDLIWNEEFDPDSDVNSLEWEGEPYSGRAFCFTNGICCEEYFFLKGKALGKMSWVFSGKVIFYEFEASGFYQINEYRIEGYPIERVSLDFLDDEHLYISANPRGEISSLVTTERAFDYLDRIWKGLLFDFKTIQMMLDTARFQSEVSLYDIGSVLFLVGKVGLERLCCLADVRLVNIDIDSNLFLLIEKLPKLKKLTLENCKNVEVLKGITSDFPGLTVSSRD